MPKKSSPKLIVNWPEGHFDRPEAKAAKNELVDILAKQAERDELTRAQTRKRQVAFVVQNGIRHYVDAHGSPVVTRAAVEGTPDAVQPRKNWQSAKAAMERWEHDSKR